MKYLYAILIASAAFMCGCASAAHSVSVADYLDEYTLDGDATLAFRRAVEECRRTGAAVLEVPAGEYHLYPHCAFEKYCYVSNNSAGLKRFVFDLAGHDGLTVEGNGAKLVLHGYVSAFTVDSCRDVEIRNLTVDYARTFHSEGRIVRAGDGWLDLTFPADYRYAVRNGDLHFSDAEGNSYPFSHLLEFSAERREPEFMADDYWLTDSTIPAEVQPDGSVRIFKKGLRGTPGNILLLGPAHRLCPAFAISDSRGVTLRDVTIRHCGGMGVVAQRSGDVELNRVFIEPDPESGRMISITADATHFSHCDGYVRMIDCRFFNQVDDATNIHGMYGIVEHILSSDRILVRFPHDQQYGLDVIRAGEPVEMVKKMSLMTYDSIGVKSVVRLNKERYEVTFDRPVAAEASEGDLITEMRYPEVLVKGCRMGNNRARGLLLGSRKHTVVEDCWFHTPGSPIYFEGDGYYWYEQAGVRDVVIRNNVFDNCNYGKYGCHACISVGSGPRENRAESMYNRNIVIEDNTFRVFDPRILNLYSVDGCRFAGNRIERTDDYPFVFDDTRRFVTEDCANIDIRP
ncbi:MAG: right-handed parallel beta-helix repeat-containing protein [Alistipes sp.]|nr:right-handed parallel beta-helix repeat-containing protein [Alistipes sp.]